jgi:protein SCO1/2
MRSHDESGAGKYRAVTWLPAVFRVGVARMIVSLLLPVVAWAGEPPNVVTSIRPLHSLVSGVMQGVAEPRLMIDGASTPWAYRPDAGDKALLASADLVVWSGVELEPGLADVLKESRIEPQGRVIDVLSDDILKVLPARHDDRLRDPFYWLDTRNMLMLLDVVAQHLAEIDPGRADLYRRNWRRMSMKLGELDRNLEFGYREVSGLPVFFYHDTHQYFQQAYAMHVAGNVAVYDLQPPPDTGHILQMRSNIIAADRTCFFTELGMLEPRLDLLLMNTDVQPVELDSLGSTLSPGPDLYPTLMKQNFAAIANCVKAQRPEQAPAAVADLFPVPDVRNFPLQIEPRYAMSDPQGRLVTAEDFHGRLQVIYFGYTFCPDICPTSLAVLSQALRMLDEDAAQAIQPIFITVDPARDRPELLAEYVSYFHPRMIGLSASPEVTKRTAELFRARYEFVPSDSGDPDRYSMDHTASLYLLGRDGEFITKFAHGLSAQDVANRLMEHLATGDAG